MCLDCFITSPRSASAVERTWVGEGGIESYEAAIGMAATKAEEVRTDPERRNAMLWTIFVILLVLWLLGLITSYTLGGFVHILLVLAVVVLVINLVQGRRAV